ncbi:hypothetical protein LARI1_G005005 [Lachnellula arida]|uniref:RING-type domain-containing protein n=1 Tax=Lachnellula arida TaxID=1316785 RepID=A0A8T9B8Y4_9HELO|nr:hypothetical protein LARI1_G005005 [Lachnellula arida]
MDYFDVLEEETANLILQLQISDGLDLYETFEGKGKHRQGELTDAQLALQIYTEDLKQQGAASDRETACRLGGVAQHAPVEPWTVGSEFLNDETLEKLKALYICAPIEDPKTGGQKYIENGDSTPESSEWAASRKVTTTPSKVQCAACQENFPFYDTARVPCGHEYCRTCLKDLFRASITDDSLFPPKCCRQTIPTGSVRIHLTGDLVRQYEAKKIEYETKDRTYCSNVLCFAFIRVENIENEKATCPVCTEVTCTISCSTPQMKMAGNAVMIAEDSSSLISAVTTSRALVDQNSATPVPDAGRLVRVHSGTRIDYSQEQIKSLTVSL